MSNNLLKKIIFILILNVILVNSNLRSEGSKKDLTEILEQNLTELEELEIMQNDEVDIQQNNSPYFKDLDKSILLQNDDKKEIRSSKAAKISEKADFIFNIIENAENKWNEMVTRKRGREGSEQNGMKDSFDKITIKGKPLSDNGNSVYRESLYSSLDWDRNLLEKFKNQLSEAILQKSIKEVTDFITLVINIQINFEEALKTIFLYPQTKSNLYKISDNNLTTIKAKVNKIITLRKKWSEIMNNASQLFTDDLYRKAQATFDQIKNIFAEIKTILKNKK